MEKPISLLFVCLGNICRSPAAEGNFRHLVERKGLDRFFRIDSAGTSSYHIGEPPNSNTCRVAEKHGVLLDHQARRVNQADYAGFDYLLAMDRANYQEMLSRCPAKELESRIIMFRAFDPDVHGLASSLTGTRPRTGPDVPDPYYMGMEGFEEVQEIAYRTAENLLEWLRITHRLDQVKA